VDQHGPTGSRYGPPGRGLDTLNAFVAGRGSGAGGAV